MYQMTARDEGNEGSNVTSNDLEISDSVHWDVQVCMSRRMPGQ